MDKCWTCKYFEYDEIYDPESNEEYQLAGCKLGYDVDDEECGEDYDKE